MFSFLPTPSNSDRVNHSWDEMVLRGNSITWDYLRKLIEDFWPKVVTFLSKIRNIDIADPTDEAWFHIRRACHGDRNEIDVLRLKRGFLPVKDVESIRSLAGRYSGITHANWQAVNFEKRHDNPFLSFLQKLSVLRGRDKICHNEFLGQTAQGDYDKDPGCQKAYTVMTSPNCAWSPALDPWFKHMSSTHMDNYRTHEYAHWFGHILSGWPDDIEQ